MAAMITAHSGCDGTPDNSFVFLRYALASDADALEIDIHPKPGCGYYLSHDEAGDECPDLADAFAMLVPSSKRVNCDLKQPGMELGVLALAKEYGIEDRVLFSGDVAPTLVRDNAEIRSRTLLNLFPIARQMLQNIDLGIEPTQPELDALAEQCRKYRVGVVNVPYILCTDLFLDTMAQNGIGVSAWTVNDEAAARRLLERNIFNVTTRRAAMVCALRKG